MNPQGKISKIAWTNFEHNHFQKKSTDWFWGMGIITAGVAILSLYFGNVLFTIIVLLSAIISSMLVNKKPKLLNFEISRKGVKAGPILYPYSNLESFWVDDGEFEDKIIFKSKKALGSYVIIPFDSTVTDADEIRDYLLDYLDEEEMEETLSQVILELLGFH